MDATRDQLSNRGGCIVMFTDEPAVLRRPMSDMLDPDSLCLPNPDDFRVGEDDE